MRDRIHGYYKGSKKSARLKLSDASIRVTLHRLRKKGFVENKNRVWQITKMGRRYLSQIFPSHSRIPTRKDSKSIVVVFDIPEVNRKKRDWLRRELICLGFEMLQRSVWFGPAPLPAEFVDSLQKLQFLKHVKFFDAKEADII